MHGDAKKREHHNCINNMLGQGCGSTASIFIGTSGRETNCLCRWFVEKLKSQNFFTFSFFFFFIERHSWFLQILTVLEGLTEAPVVYFPAGPTPADPVWPVPARSHKSSIEALRPADTALLLSPAQPRCISPNPEDWGWGWGWGWKGWWGVAH